MVPLKGEVQLLAAPLFAVVYKLLPLFVAVVIAPPGQIQVLVRDKPVAVAGRDVVVLAVIVAAGHGVVLEGAADRGPRALDAPILVALVFLILVKPMAPRGPVVVAMVAASMGRIVAVVAVVVVPAVAMAVATAFLSFVSAVLPAPIPAVALFRSPVFLQPLFLRRFFHEEVLPKEILWNPHFFVSEVSFLLCTASNLQHPLCENGGLRLSSRK